MQEVIDSKAASEQPIAQPQVFCLLIFPQQLAEEVVAILDDLGVPGFTETEKVTGRGRRGRHFDNPIWPGADGAIFSVVKQAQAEAIAGAVWEFSRRLESESRGLYGLRMFTWACQQIV